MKWQREQRYHCQTYLMAWAAGNRGKTTEDHVRNCTFCHDIIFGGTEEFPLSLEDEASRMRTDRRRARRRAFLTGIAVAAGTVGIVGLSMLSFKTAETASAPDPIVRNTNRIYSLLDSRMATGGVAAIEGVFQTAPESKVLELLDWVADREHANLYHLFAAAVVDRRLEVQLRACRVMRSMDRASLKPQVTALTASLQGPMHDITREAVQALLGEIEDA